MYIEESFLAEVIININNARRNFIFIGDTPFMENQYIIDFYTNYNEEGRLTHRYGTVEFLTTMRYIENT